MPPVIQARCRWPFLLAVLLMLPASALAQDGGTQAFEPVDHRQTMLEITAAIEAAPQIDDQVRRWRSELTARSAAADQQRFNRDEARRVAVQLWKARSELQAQSYYRRAYEAAVDTTGPEELAQFADDYLESLLLDGRFQWVIANQPEIFTTMTIRGAPPTALSRVIWQLGEARRETGDLVGAAESFAQAQEHLGPLQPENAQQFVLNAIASASLVRENGGEAKGTEDGIASLTQALASLETAGLPPDLQRRLSAQVQTEVGRLYIRSGQTQDAVKPLQASLQLRQQAPEHLSPADGMSALNATFLLTHLYMSNVIREEPAGNLAVSADAARYLTRHGFRATRNYRTRPMHLVELDLIATGGVIQSLPAEIRAGMPNNLLNGADQTIFEIAEAGDSDPYLQLFLQRASAMNLPPIERLVKLIALADERVAAGLLEDEAVANLLTDAVLTLRMAGYGKQDDSDAARRAHAIMPLAAQAAAAVGTATGRTGARAAPIMTGFSSLFDRIRGGNGAASDIAFALHLEVLDEGRMHPRLAASVDPQAFETLQWATARSLDTSVSDLLDRSAAGTGKRGELVRALQASTAAIALSVRTIQEMLGSGQQDQLRLLSQDLKAQRAARARLEADLQARFPELGSTLARRNLSLEEAQSHLEGDEALVIIYGGENLPPEELRTIRSSALNRATNRSIASGFPGHGVYVGVLTQEEFTWRKADIGAADLTARVRTLRCQLDGQSCGSAAGRQRAFDPALASELYQLLLAPSREVLAGKSQLLLVAPGALSALPLSVLWTQPPEQIDDPQEFRNAPWLLREVAIVRLPTVSSLALRDRRDVRLQGTTGLMGFGDPELTDLPADAPSLPQLPYSRIELAMLESVFGQGNSDVFVREDATEANLAAAQDRKHALVVFSTHGIASGSWPGTAEPGLVLSASGVGRSNDGFLSASEAALLDLSADLVVLSACRTAAPDGEAVGDSFTGLARSFLVAGASSVLVTHWDVRDDIAASVVVGALERIREDPELGSGLAMRAALLEVIRDRDQPERADPSIWAPFSILALDP